MCSLIHAYSAITRCRKRAQHWIYFDLRAPQCLRAKELHFCLTLWHWAWDKDCSHWDLQFFSSGTPAGIFLKGYKIQDALFLPDSSLQMLLHLLNFYQSSYVSWKIYLRGIFSFRCSPQPYSILLALSYISRKVTELVTCNSLVE